MNTKAHDEHRLRRYMLPIHEALGLLRIAFHELGGCKYIELPQGRGIPEGATVRSVYWDHPSQCFGIVVEHESFGPIPYGHEIPRAGTASLKRRVFEVLKTAPCEGEEATDAIAVDRNGQPICNSQGEPVMPSPICDGHEFRKLATGDWQVNTAPFIPRKTIDDAVRAWQAKVSKAFFRGAVPEEYEAEGADAGCGSGAADPAPMQHDEFIKWAKAQGRESAKPKGLERFTDRARRVLQLANQEAQRHNHDWIGAEHVLLGLIKEGSGVAGHVLASLGANWEKARRVANDVLKPGPSMVTMGKLPETERTKRVLEFARREADRLEHRYVGTEHILLGLLLEFAREICEEKLTDAQSGSPAFQLFDALGLGVVPVRAEVMRLLGIEESHASGLLDETKVIWEKAENAVFEVQPVDKYGRVLADEKAEPKSDSCQCPSLLNGHLPGCPEAK